MIKMTIEEMRKVTLNVKLFDRETCLKIAKEKNKNDEYLTDEVLLMCLPEDAFGNAHRCFVRKSGVAIWYNGKYSGYKNGYRGNYLDVPDCFIEYAFIDGIDDKGGRGMNNKSVEQEGMKMTPKEFEKRMLYIDQYDDDTENGHIEADALMVKVLRQLGYESGCDVFEKMAKWYA